MGVRGLWNLVAPVAQHRSFRELAVNEGFVRNRRGLRSIIVGIDAAIWLSQAQHAFATSHAQAGENPELRALFFKLVHLLQSPVTPLFVFDGPGRPNKKRGVNVVKKPVWITAPFQEMLDAFQFQYYTAPGEAEAELARLNRAWIIDAVITEDSDALVFGATHVIRGWTAGNDTVQVYTANSISTNNQVALTCGGMLLVALLSGNDYDSIGLEQVGPKISLGLARAGLGDKLLSAACSLPESKLKDFLSIWQQELRTELAENSRGMLSQKFRSLVNLIPEDFLNLDHLRYYATPVTSFTEGTAGPDLSLLHPRPPDITRLARICHRRFGWECNRTGSKLLKQFEKSLWGGLCLQMVCYEDLVPQFRHQYPIKSSAIKRVRMAKLGSGLTSGLLDYRVDFSTRSLIDAVKIGFKSTQEPQEDDSLEILDCVCSTWIPAPILDRCVPQMVASYRQACSKSHAPESGTAFERVFVTPPPSRERSFLPASHQLASSSVNNAVVGVLADTLDSSSGSSSLSEDVRAPTIMMEIDLTQSDHDSDNSSNEDAEMVIDLTQSN